MISGSPTRNLGELRHLQKGVLFLLRELVATASPDIDVKISS